MARKRAAEVRAEQWAESRRQREEEDQRQRVMVITEFDAGDAEATMHAMATEILRFRLCVRQFADAIELTRAGAEFGLLRPGPSWRPKRAPEMPDAVPPAA
jgi:HAMP domain-containing protein